MNCKQMHCQRRPRHCISLPVPFYGINPGAARESLGYNFDDSIAFYTKSPCPQNQPSS